MTSTTVSTRKAAKAAAAAVVPDGADARLPFSSVALATQTYTPTELQVAVTKLASANVLHGKVRDGLMFHNANAMHAGISNGAIGKLSKSDVADGSKSAPLWETQGDYAQALGLTVAKSLVSKLVRLGRAITVFGYTPEHSDWTYLTHNASLSPIGPALMGTNKAAVTKAIRDHKRGIKATPRTPDGSTDDGAGTGDVVTGDVVVTEPLVQFTAKEALRVVVMTMRDLDREGFAAFENSLNDALRAETAQRVKDAKAAAKAAKSA